MNISKPSIFAFFFGRQMPLNVVLDDISSKNCCFHLSFDITCITIGAG